ncbi:MFS transporter, partial [Sulfitobacter sp. HI0021]
MPLPLIFILVTVMIDAMGVGLILPVMPDLIREVRGGGLSDAALWGGVLATGFAAMQFLFGPVLGGLSDRFGRRPVLLLALVVMTVDYGVMALAGSVWLLLIGRLVGGVTAATHATASAYMADISPAQDRAARFGLIGAAFGAGFVLGPLMG